MSVAFPGEKIKQEDLPDRKIHKMRKDNKHKKHKKRSYIKQD
jgi:hypothetical protein